MTGLSTPSKIAASLIAVRLDSRRLQGKALLTIHGRSALSRLVARVRLAKVPTQVILCTTTRQVDDRLEGFAKEEGIECYRGETDDVLSRMLGAAQRCGAQTVVRVTGDDPLSDPEYIDRALLVHWRMNADYTKTEGLPFGVGREVIQVSAMVAAHRMIDKPQLREHLTWFFDDPSRFRVAALAADEQHRRPHYRLTLDYPEDLLVLSEIFKRLDSNGGNFCLDDVIQFLDSNPKLACLNSHCKSATMEDVFAETQMPRRV